jgi:glycosyltransferase involved in cell wall biosynthesis
VGRLTRRLALLWITKDLQRYGKSLSPTLELFSDDRAAGGNELTRSLPDGDVYNLHWVAGLLDYRRFFAEFPAGTPLVWTLHDMNPFTGGCHYTLGCEKFKKRCGCCPQLGSTNASDLTFQVLARKQASLERLNPLTTRVVATSTWMEGEARTSALLGRFDVLGIPYGLDTDVFQPRDRRVAREVFGLPQNHRVVMFAAQSLRNHRKGYDLLVGALDGIASDNDAPITLASVGEAGMEVKVRTHHVPLGQMLSQRLLSFAYSAADVFVISSRAEAFGQVVFEAMACGTPVVGFDVGGIPDMVRPRRTGLLVPPQDVAALRSAIETVINDDELRGYLSAECRRVAVEEYALGVQADRYKRLYEGLIEASRSLPLSRPRADSA